MMLFSERLEAEKEFDEWRKQQKYEPSRCPMNVIGWLCGDGKHWLAKMIEDVKEKREVRCEQSPRD